MKKVILSADNTPKIYLVPDAVADDLDAYCIEFCDKWIWHDPNGAKLLKEVGGEKCAVYTEKDFIDYLNKWKFPDQPSKLVGILCALNKKDAAAYPRFNF